MAIPTLQHLFDETLEGQDRNGPQTATSLGALRWVDGPRTERKWVSPLLVASPEHSEDRQGPLAPFLSSSVTLGEGQFNKTWKLKKANTAPPLLLASPIESRDQSGSVTDVYEETENLARNPALAASSTGWGYYVSPQYGHRVTTARVNTQPDMGTEWSHQINVEKYDGAGNWLTAQCVSAIPEVATGTKRPFVGSITVKTNREAAARPFLRINYTSGGYTDTYAPLPAIKTDTTPRRIVTPVAYSDPERTVASIAVYLQFYSTLGSGDTIWITKAQIEEKDHPTAYVDGDMPEGTWTGEPRLSSSTRARGSALKGAVRGTQDGWLIEEGTTNLIPNPRLGTGYANWSASSGVGSALSSARVNTQPDVSEWCWEVVSQDAVNTWRAPQVTVTPDSPIPAGTPLTGRIRIKASQPLTATLRLRVQFTDESPHEEVVQSVTLGTTVQDFITDTYVVPEGKSVRWVGILLFVQNEMPVGSKVWMSEAQVEEKPYATSYCDGDKGAGYSWTGTPHRSASVREGGYIDNTTRHVNPERGEMVWRWKPARENFYVATPSVFRSLFMFKTGGGSENWTMYKSTDGTAFTISCAGQILGWKHNRAANDQEWITFSYRWAVGETQRLYVNGELVAESDWVMSSAPTLNTALSFTGSPSTTNTNKTSNIVKNLLVFPRPLTDTERAYITSALEDDWVTWDALNEVDGEVVIGHQPTTNLLVRPDPTAGIGAYRTGLHWGTSFQMSEDRPAGSSVNSWRVTTDGANMDEGIVFFSADKPLGTSTSAQSVVGSFWLKGNTGKALAPLVQVHYTDGTTTRLNVMGTSEHYVNNWYMSGTWQYVTIGPLITTQGKTIESVRLVVRQYSTDKGPRDFLVNSPQVEASPYATPYTDGFQNDAEWNGDPHNAPSIRQGRGDMNYTKDVFIRYREDGDYKASRVQGRAGVIGSSGRYTTFDGSLRLTPFEGRTLEVEDVVVFDRDVSTLEEKVLGIQGPWNFANTSSIMDVPNQIPYIEEGTTNLFRNPSALVDTTNAFAARGKVERGTADGVSTGTCFVVTRTSMSSSFYFNTNGGSTTGSNIIPINANQWVTTSLSLKGPAGKELCVRALGFDVDRNVIRLGTDEIVNLTGEWQRIACTRQPSSYASNITGYGFFVMDSYDDFQIGESFLITDIQVEQLRYPTRFCPQFDEFGHLAEGHSWEGDPFNSASSRTTSYIRINPSSTVEDRGAIAFWHTPTIIETKGHNPHLVYGSGINLYRNARNTTYSLILGGNMLGGPSRNFGEGSQFVYIDWQSGWKRIFINGELYTEGPYSNPVTLPESITLGATSQFSFDGSVTAFMVFDRPLTDAEIAKLYETDEWEWDTLFPKMGGLTRVRPQEPLGMIRAAKPIVNKVNTSSSGSEE